MSLSVEKHEVPSSEEVKKDIDSAISNLMYFSEVSLGSFSSLACLAPDGDAELCFKPLLEVVSDRASGDFSLVFNSVIRLSKHLQAFCPDAAREDEEVTHLSVHEA